MTKSMRKLLQAACAIMFTTALSYCSKDGSSTPASKTDFLSKQAWKIDKSGLDADKNGTIDLEDTWEACELDNTYLFKSDGTGIFDEGATKCNLADAQTGSFTWSFSAGETILNGNIPQLSLSGDATISTLNSTTLEVYKDVTIPGAPVPVRYVLRLKH
jgi:hypothetical protein